MAVLKHTFKFLPTPTKNKTTEKILKELKENITKLDSNEEIKTQQLELSSKIIDRLTNGEWTEQDYNSFYQSINQNTTESLANYSLPAIINIFSCSEDELKNALEEIKENTKDLEIPLYPYRKLVTTEDKRQALEILDYNKMDAFKMVVIILSKMSVLQVSEIKKLFVERNRKLTLELLTELVDGKREDTAFVPNLDKEFGFLKEIDVFKELYLNYRKEYITLIWKNFAYRCQEESNHHKNNEQRFDIKRFSDIKYQRKKTTVGGYYKILTGNKKER